MEDLAPRLIGAALVALGLWLIHHHRRSQERVRRARLWPCARGEVLESEVKRHRRKSSSAYEARIRYRYEVGGRAYTSRDVCIGGQLTAGRSRAQARCDKYPVGSSPEVFYDPSRPERACLERIHEGAWVELAGAAFGLVAGAALLLGYLPDAPDTKLLP